jgi:hypothetical protein
MARDPARDQTAYATADKTGRILVRTGFRRKQIPLDVALNEQPFRFNGDFLYADDLSTGVVTVKLNNTSEDPLPFKAQSMVEGWPIQDVFVTCAAQPGLVMNLWYGWQGRIRPPQQVVQIGGSISLAITATGAPQGLDKTVSNGNAFRVMGTIGAVAAQNGFLQLFNPGGSGKRVYVDAFFVDQLAAPSVIAYAFDTGAMVNDLGAALNNLAGGAASTAHLRSSTNAGFPGTMGASVDWSQQAAANTFALFVLPTPLIIDQGNGVNLRNTTQNQLLNGGFYFREY